MAIYHLSTKPISRSSGRTATASIAYRAGIAIQDERTGKQHDYTKRSGVVATQLHTPNNLKIERNELWNLAETTETRKNSRTAREIVVNLPHELSEHDRSELVNDFAKDLANKYGVAVDVAIHTPDKEGDNRNHHAHLMLTTRKLERLESGRIALTSKSQLEMSNTQLKTLDLPSAKEELKAIRKQWADITNERLEQAEVDARIDHRSHKDRGLILKPTKKLGWEATALERKGIATETGNHNRQIKAFNQSVRELMSLNRQLKQIKVKEQANERAKPNPEPVSPTVVKQTSPSSPTNERGQRLQTASSSKGDKLGQAHTSEVRRSDSSITSTSLRNKLSNSKVLGATTKQQLKVVIDTVEIKFADHPTHQLEKYEAISDKIDQLEQQRISEVEQARETIAKYNQLKTEVEQAFEKASTKPLRQELSRLKQAYDTAKKPLLMTQSKWATKQMEERTKLRQLERQISVTEANNKGKFEQKAKNWIATNKPDREQSYQEAQQILREHNEIQQQQDTQLEQQRVRVTSRDNDKGMER